MSEPVAGPAREPRPDVARMYAAIRRANQPRIESMSLEDARAAPHVFIKMQGEREPVEEVVDLSVPGTLPGLRVRAYRPRGAGAGSLPAIVYFHGGGWVIGDLEVADRPCRQLANAAGAALFSVDYRLAPEHPFPAAFEDCAAATWWVHSAASELRVDPGRLLVGGDSAGGNLAAAVAIAARERGIRLAGQLLAYPALEPASVTSSYRDNADDGFLPASTMRWYWRQYLGEELQGDWRAAPPRARDLSGVAPAYIGTAELDVLRDEGDRYAERLRAAGVSVRHHRYPGLAHGLLWLMEATPSAGELFADMASAAREFAAAAA